MKIITSCLLLGAMLSCHSAKAQKVQLGTSSEHAKGELKAADPVMDKRHYGSLTLTIKAGSGILLYMHATGFTPSIFVFGTNNEPAGYSSNPKAGEGSEAYVAINAFEKRSFTFYPRDTAINIFFTSAEEGATGKFDYGFYLLDSMQMVYKQKGSTCDRISYLINQWQAWWLLIPHSIDYESPRGYMSLVDRCFYPVKDYNKGLGSGYIGIGERLGELRSTYTETIFNSMTNNGAKFYDSVVAEIKTCLGKEQWEYATTTEEPSRLVSEKKVITTFHVKGAGKNDIRSTFALTRIIPNKVDDQNPYKVLLIFF
jgi:hypothetical protein